MPNTKAANIRYFRVGDIRPNPFRDVERYPLQEKKIEALQESIRATSFWPTITARIGADGAPAIAFGHHRIQAARELGEAAQIPLTIQDLSDEEMLQMMVSENMTEWGTSALVEQQSVRAVVLAYGDGRVELPAPDPNTAPDRLRYAPSFVCGQADDPNTCRDRRPYTSSSIASWLGWKKEKVRVTLQALELAEFGFVTAADFRELGTAQARAVTQQARKAASGALLWARTVPEQREHFLDMARHDVRVAVEVASNALRKGTASVAGVGDLVPKKRVPRGLLRQARRPTTEQKDRDKEKKKVAKVAAERDALKTFSEDCLWFVQAVQEIAPVAVSKDARATVRKLAARVRKSIEGFEA